MELRMQPLTNENQTCTAFSLQLSPSARIFEFIDQFDNTVQHFDIPGKHKQLEITTKSFVEVFEKPEPPESLPFNSWKTLEEDIEAEDFWEFLLPSQFAQATKELFELKKEFEANEKDPLTLLREINSFFKANFEYCPDATEVDSPIDIAIKQRSGVCQDFANIMIALVRSFEIPCRYVSGYLSPGGETRDRSAEGATHAWAEAYLPALGWVGFDPTNDVLAADRHIRVAVGRDYADVPPTRGVFRGEAGSVLGVLVTVSLADSPMRSERVMPMTTWVAPAVADTSEPFEQEQQQQQ